MSRRYTQLAFTESVKRAQEQYGTRAQGARLESSDAVDTTLSDRESGFIEERDGFYVASVGDQGWPYVQFRGGPRGFLRVLDERTLGYADFRGNLQYITTGNITQDDRVALFLMDYANQRRLKIMARARIHPAAERPDLIAKLEDPDYRARIERAVIFEIEAFDWNCPQHITPRLTEAERAPTIENYEARIRELEQRLAATRTP